MFYIGSANFAWSALSHVRELGVCIYESKPVFLKNEARAAFLQYWGASCKVRDGCAPKFAPAKGPFNLFNAGNQLSLDNRKARGFLAASPPALLPRTRTHDLDCITDLINNATIELCVQTMDFIPEVVYAK